MNIELLKRVRDKILADPDSFDVNEWHSVHDCQTTMCIAGWACRLVNDTDKRAWFISEHAIKYLGITYNQSKRLFYEDQWPFELQLHGIDNVVERAERAAKRIDRFIESQGQD